ncbi:hypothetical protein FS593_14125 [Lelliottia amnigena]|nr:hypothetical protein FS593_14125 [Lelliottia amnigena]
MQAMPSPRVPARRPGLTETLRRFSAGPEHRFHLLISIRLFPAARKRVRFIQTIPDSPSYFLHFSAALRV